MVHLGRFNTLPLIRLCDRGAMLDAGTLGPVLLPAKQCPESLEADGEARVFLYRDGRDQLIATTRRPHACAGQFAHLKVVATGDAGAFLDWGMKKDLLLPRKEQQGRPKVGERVVVYLYLDEVGRMVASARIDRFLDRWPVRYQRGDEVELLIHRRSDIGIKAIVDHRHWGVLYESELFRPVKFGQRLRGYIKQVREDGKIDLTLHRPGHRRFDVLAERILARLEAEGGALPLNDKSPPEAIHAAFGESKKSFKSALGRLYKARRILFTPQGIALRREGEE